MGALLAVTVMLAALSAVTEPILPPADVRSETVLLLRMERRLCQKERKSIHTATDGSAKRDTDKLEQPARRSLSQPTPRSIFQGIGGNVITVTSEMVTSVFL
jgi:hypothetical protein